jgi:hypothetical protein
MIWYERCQSDRSLLSLGGTRRDGKPSGSDARLLVRVMPE